MEASHHDDIREGSSDPPHLPGVQETTITFTPEGSPQTSPPRPVRPPMTSCVSRVSIGFFDPEGICRLQDEMSAIASGQAPGPPKTPGEELTKEIDKLTRPDGEQFNFEKALREFVKKRAQADIKSRELGVHFEDLRVVGLGATATYQPTVGSLLNPLNIVQAIKGMMHPPLRDILTGFEGVVHPGEMLLVLGSPGSGCTTLLKVLTNQRSEYHAIHGTVSYDSLTPSSIAHHYRGDIQYCPEDDIHFPTLTVEQTIEFAASTRAPQARINVKSREEYVRVITNVYATIFGLMHVMHTRVGDQAIRGVSGGEKKRVSISEALATRSLINAWDNSTRGLDASTALEFIRALRIATDIARTSTIVSIYQASESLYDLFDKVCVIYQGRMVYFGPPAQARNYFCEMGWKPANRQTTPDFLVAVTDPAVRAAREGVDVHALPKTGEEFEAYWKRSELAGVNRADMDSYKERYVGRRDRAVAYKESAVAEHAKTARRKSAYVISLPMQVRAVMKRRVRIFRGDLGTQVIIITTFILQAIIVGTVFVNTPDDTSAFFSRGGVLFFSLFLPALSSSSEVPALFSQRPIVLRHANAAMYHPFVEALATTLVDIPITFLTILPYGVILFFIVGLQRTAGQFFIYILFIFAVAIVVKALFRSLAAAFRSEAPAQAVVGVLLLALSLYTGYIIPLPSMIGALKWISYINPIRYGFEALMTNEFHTINAICSQLVPSGPTYADISPANQVCTTVGSVPGQNTVSGSRFVEVSFGYSQSHLWRNFGIVLAFGGLFIAALLLFSEYNTGTAGQYSIVLFKRGSKVTALDKAGAAAADEESAPGSGSVSSTDNATLMESPKREDGATEEAMREQPPMKDVFSWSHLNYVVSVGKGEQKKLLDDVSGYVKPGKLTLLMGSSGAGKTTLLNVLAERVAEGVVTGDRFVNGQRLPKDFQAQTGYCQQTDTHVPTTTVREALVFSAMMRQPESVPPAEKEAYAERCLKMCGLEAYADAMVGTLGVELKKRTTIGVELAAKPRLLLFLDEPTSGLDSQSAWAIVVFLRSLADSGQAILCTMHQPSAELFQVFDRILLLRKGGQTIYFGDLGHHATTLIRYFETHGARACNDEENPAEYMLDVTGAGATASISQDWHETWTSSEEYKAALTEMEELREQGRKRPPVEATLESMFATGWVHQTGRLLWRDLASYWRNPTYIMSKLMLNIIGGLFIGFTFFKAKNTIQGTQNKLFAIFMATILSAPLGQQLVVPYINLWNIYKIRERPSRMYHWSALITSQIIVELPWNVLGSSLFFVCWYFTVGFEPSRAGYTYLMYGVLFPIYYTTVAQAVASTAQTSEIAGLLYSFIFSFVLTFDGVIQPYSHLGWWKWMYRLSPFTYLIEGLLGQAIGHQEVVCSTKELATLNPPSGMTCGAFLERYISEHGGYLVNPDASSPCSYCSTRTTDQFMESSFNIFYQHHWRDAGLFFAYIAFNVLMVYVLTYLFRIRSHGSLLAKIRKRFTHSNHS